MERIETLFMLAGGAGSRLWPMSLNKMKASLVIGGKSIAQHMSDFFTDQIEIERSVISLNHRYCGRQRELALNSIEPQYLYEEKSLGTAGAFVNYLSTGEIKGELLMLNLDLFISDDLERFIEFHRSANALCTIFSVEVDNPHSYGLILKDKNDHVLSFKEKDRSAIWRLRRKHSVNGGLYLFSETALKILKARYGTVDYPLSMEYDLLPWMIKQYSKLVYAYSASENSYWLDLGKRENFIKGSCDLQNGRIAGYNNSIGHRFIATNDSIVELGGADEGSVRDQLLKTKLSNSLIYSGVEIGDYTELEDSIICANTKLPPYSTLLRCVVGENTSFLDGVYNLKDTGIAGELVFIKTPSVDEG
jgi:NDP-sugar pyrophosphorylase family protein